MSRNNSTLVLERNNSITKKRMYKAKGQWNVATTGAVVLGALGVGVVATAQHANADEIVQGDSSVEAPVVDTGNVAVSSVANSANTAIADTFTTSHNNFENVGATLDQAPTETVNVPVGGVESATNYIASDANSQIDHINTVASANNDIYQAVSNNSSVTNAVGGSITANEPSDVSSLDNSTISSIGTSYAENINAVGTANTDVSNAIKTNSDVVSQAGGVLKPGKPIDASSMSPAQISESASKAVDMINATGSADSVLLSASTEYTDNITRTGGSLVRSGSINTADNMTVSDVDSSVKSQVARISETASANDAIYDAVSKASDYVASASGVLSAGSSIDTTTLTPEELASIVAHQSQMVSATADADKKTIDAVNSNTSDVVNIGGTIKRDGDINTADNMKADEVVSMGQSQAENITATGEADKKISDAVEANKDVVSQAGGSLNKKDPLDMTGKTGSEVTAIGESQVEKISLVGSHDGQMIKDVESATPIVSGAGGVMTPGSALDVTSMTPDEIKSEAQRQHDMIDVTAKADQKISDTVNSARPDIEGIGGTLSQTGTVNTADNMTVSDVESHVNSQETHISNTASADRVISEAVKNNKGSIEVIGGVVKPGSAIDVTNMSSEEIASIAAHQKEMVDATGSADKVVSDAVQSGKPDIEVIGGTLKKDGDINTADNMTVEQIHSSVQSQSQTISNTASADRVISEAVKNNKGSIEVIGGVIKPGSAIDVTNMSSEEIASIAAHQKAMVDATGSADKVVSDAVQSGKPDIEAIGGTIKKNGDINTADNMTVEQIHSSVQSQSQTISNTASADRVISEAVKNNKGSIEVIGGVIKPGSAIDVTNMSSEEIASIAAHQKAMVDATGSADKVVSDAVQSGRPDIEAIGGTIKKNGDINTADNMTVEQIKSSVQSQSQTISNTASADRVISEAVKNNKDSIEVIGGVIKPGSAIDVTDMSSEEIASIAAHQKAMVDATGSADVVVSNTVKNNKGFIENAGGKITKNGDINTADNMTVDQIKSSVQSQAGNINAVGSNDKIIKEHQDKADAESKPFGGSVVTGSAVDATGMTVDQINKHGQSQVEKIDTVAHNNKMLSDTEIKVSDVVNAVGGKVQKGEVIDVSSMTTEQIVSMAQSQNATLSAVGEGDRIIGSAITNNMNSIQIAGGKILSAGAINMAGKTASEVLSNANSQASNIVETGQGDYRISNAVNDTKPVIDGYGGSVNRKPEIDVTGKSGSEVKSMADSQVDNLNGTKDATIKVSNAEKAARGDIEAFGGSLSKGQPTNVAGKTSSEINAIAQHQADVLSATASGDKQLSQVFDQTNGDVTAIGGVIKKASTNTANMSVDQINSQVASQAQNMKDVASADRVISNGIKNNKADIEAIGGHINKRQSTDASRMSASDMANLANSQITNMENVASADRDLKSHVDINKNAITTAGGMITNRGNTDATNMTAQQIKDNVLSQGANLSATAMGDNVLSKAEGKYADTTTRGSASDVTGKSSEAIAEFVASQTTSIGATNDAKHAIVSAVNSATGTITGIGGQIKNADSRVETTHMSGSSMASIVNANIGKIEATSSADGQLTKAVNDARAIITANGGTLSQAGEVWTNNMSTSDVKYHMDSQEAKIKGVVRADSVINSAIAAHGDVVVKRGAVNADNMTQEQRDNYAQNVANTINTAATANNNAKNIADQIRNAGGNVTANGFKTVNDAGQINNSANNNISNLNNALATQNSANAMRDATNKANATIDGLSSQAQNGGLEVSWDQTITVHNQAELDSVIAMNNQRVQDALNEIGQLHANNNTYPTEPTYGANGYTAGNTMQVLNYKGQNNNFDGKGSSITIKDAGAMNNWNSVTGNPDLIRVISSTIKQGQVIKSIIWRNGVKPEVVKGSMTPGKIPGMSYDTNPNGTTDQEYMVTSGTILKFPGIVTMVDGSKHDLLVEFTFGGNSTDGSGLMQIWNQDGAINGGFKSNGHVHNDNWDKVDFRIDSWDNAANGPDYLWTSFISDIDVAQKELMGHSRLLAIGGGLKASGDGASNTMAVKADPNLGWNYGQDLSKDGLHGLNSYPDGTVLSYYYGKSYQLTLSDDGGGAYAPMYGYFGQGAMPNAAIIDTNVSLAKVNYDWQPVNVSYDTYNTEVSALSATYTPYSVVANTDWNYTTTPLSTTYSALDTTYSALDTTVNVLSDLGGYTPFTTDYAVYSTSFNALSDIGGYNPELLRTTPLSTIYKSYSTDGTNIPPVIPDGKGGYKINPKFTGYAPLSATYKSYSTDGTDIPPVIPDGKGGFKINPEFTGYAPLSATYKSYSTDGTDIPPVIPDGKGGFKINPEFTGYAPLSATYKSYSTDGTDIPPVIPDGKGGFKINPEFTGYAPLSDTFKVYSSDGENVPPDHNFTGYRPLSTDYMPLSTTWKSFSSDGSNIPPIGPDGKPNPNFTGFTSFSTTYSPYSSDGTDVPEGHEFTGYAPYSTEFTPMSTTYKYYNPVVEQPVVPQEPVTPTPVVPVPVNNPVPNPPAKAPVLPQLSDGDDNVVALLGVTLVALSLGAGLVERKKRKTV